ncbi:MAG: GGGtGRT protein [Blautia sp.]
MALFESYERRIDKINSVLNSYGIASIEEAEKITKDAGLDVYNQVKSIQPICFENAGWAYTVGAAIAIKKDCRRAADAAAAIGEGLQSFCIPGSVADQRKVAWDTVTGDASERDGLSVSWPDRVFRCR